MSLIINFFGGPGVSKSTTATGIFHKLKRLDHNCELVTEFAKRLTWENNMTALDNQLYVSANQIYQQEMVEDKVDYIVTDSPTILGLFYYKPEGTDIDRIYKELMIEKFTSKNNLNFLINRKKKYNPIGRIQTEEESIEIDKQIQTFLGDNNIEYSKVDTDEQGISDIIDIILRSHENR